MESLISPMKPLGQIKVTSEKCSKWENDRIECDSFIGKSNHTLDKLKEI